VTDYRADVTDYRATGPIPYPELRAVLDDLVSSARAILADDLIGFYLVGSFAVGDADLQSDCDFIAVTRRPVTSGQESHLRVLHRDIPTRNGLWTRNLEGSYAPLDDLGTLDALGRQWLYIDRGWRKMQWSTHCNSLEQRWALRERGVVLAGPSPATFAAPVPATLLRAAMAERLPRLLDDLATWIDIGKIAWGQRWASATPWKASVALFWTFADGQVHSKAASLDWAMQTFDQACTRTDRVSGPGWRAPRSAPSRSEPPPG